MSHAFYQQARDEQPRVPQEWGRAGAFERLYEDQHARIYNLAARVLGDVDEAADVTQDVFLKAFREMPALPRDVDMERWMYRVTVNACLDLLRRRRTRATSPLHDLDEMPALGDGLERAQLTHAVEAALADLNPRYRTALVLKDLHGLGNSEVADIMGIGCSTTGVLIFRARAAFRRAFAKASPVGAGPAAGLGLAAFLPMLPVPAGLQTPPPFLTPFVPAPAVPGALPSTGAVQWTGLAPAAGVPVAAGVLTKIGAVLTAKVALLAIGVTAVAGGGIAIRDGSQDAARDAGVTTPAHVTAPIVAPGATGLGPAIESSVDGARDRMLVAEKLPQREPQPGRSTVGRGSEDGRGHGSSPGAQRSGTGQSTSGTSPGQQAGGTGGTRAGATTGTGTGGSGTAGTGTASTGTAGAGSGGTDSPSTSGATDGAGTGGTSSPGTSGTTDGTGTGPSGTSSPGTSGTTDGAGPGAATDGTGTGTGGGGRP